MPFHGFCSRDVLQYKVGPEFMIILIQDLASVLMCFFKRSFPLSGRLWVISPSWFHCDSCDVSSSMSSCSVRYHLQSVQLQY